MDFNIRKLDGNDYDQTLVGWWKDWGWTPPSKDFLPDNGAGGIMVLDGDEPVCAGFIYITNSRVAWVDWIISNKNYRKKPQRKQALEFLIETLTDMSQDTGYIYTYALIKHPSLIETYEKFGYVKGDTYTSEMIKKS
jgi:hypothetical protein